MLGANRDVDPWSNESLDQILDEGEEGRRSWEPTNWVP